MSRPASQALGGFYKTQDTIRPLINRRFDVVTQLGRYVVVDPCAGEGEALEDCINAIFGPFGHRQKPNWSPTPTPWIEVIGIGIELEQERSRLLSSALYRVAAEQKSHHGDGLCADFSGTGASLLWLNPPYDFFHGQRFESRFLDKWTPALATGGQLVFIIPENVLPSVAATLTRWYEDIEVLRYPEPEYQEFKQVVVLATKRALVGDVGTLPLIGDLASAPSSLRRVPPGDLTIDVNALDIAAMRASTSPWGTATTTAAGYGRPAQPPQIGLAMKPKPAHIAMALGSGVFNGIKLTAPNRPTLLAKAIFQRTYVTTDEKKDDKGETTKLQQVEKPKLRLTILNLDTGEYRELSPGTVPSDDGALNNFADLLLHYGDSMVAAMRQRCPALHDGTEEYLRPMTRTLFPAQAHAARAALKLISRGLTPLILGEIGSGKSSTAAQIFWDLADPSRTALQAATTSPTAACFPPKHYVPLVRCALVVCPPHLITSWQNELRACLPNVPVVVLDKPSDVDRVATMPGPLVALLSRETAKLGHAVEGGARQRGAKHYCTHCNTQTAEPSKLATGRLTCTGETVEPLDVVARLAWSMRQLRGKTAMSRLRRQVAVLLLRRLHAGTSRVKASWGGYSHSMPSDEQTKLLAMLRCCVVDVETDARIVRIVKRLYPSYRSTYAYSNGALVEQEQAKGFTMKLDDSALITALASLGKWRRRPCGQPLYQAIPQPRRYPLADYITRRHPKLFQLLIADEFHEYSSESSAQGAAIHRLTEKIPLVLPLTGSLMNGYAKSLFRNLWAVSSKLREEFAHDEGAKFAKLYGYQKRVLTGDAAKKATVTEHGAVSDRVVKTEGGERTQDAPGVLPSFVLRHILPLAITLHKRDIVADDRVVDHSRDLIEIDEECSRLGEMLGNKLRDAVKRDRFNEKLAGKLFGQLAEYPSYFDRATKATGNGNDGNYTIRYPENVGGAVVAVAEGRDATTRLGKEQWLIATLRKEIGEGRRVLLFLWHKELSVRLRQLVVEAVGEEAAFLDAEKVPARKRQDWIDKHVVGKRKVLITNPTCVMTGLNNLIWFSTAVFYENPGCNPFVARQAVGRLDRITQTQEVRIYWPVYVGMQAKMLDLLQMKSAISQQIDGIDPTAALEMAGGGTGEVESMDVGLAVYKYLGG